MDGSDFNRDISRKNVDTRLDKDASRQPSRNRILADYSAAHEIFSSWKGHRRYDRYTTCTYGIVEEDGVSDITPGPDNFSQETFRTQRRVGRVVSVEIPVVN